jgi:hypothetical protein
MIRHIKFLDQDPIRHPFRQNVKLVDRAGRRDNVVTAIEPVAGEGIAEPDDAPVMNQVGALMPFMKTSRVRWVKYPSLSLRFHFRV